MLRLMDVVLDDARTTFGMREFKVSAPISISMGRRSFSKAAILRSSILSDADRGRCPGILIGCRSCSSTFQRHTLHFFRQPHRQMYNRWYDIADEHGCCCRTNGCSGRRPARRNRSQESSSAGFRIIGIIQASSCGMRSMNVPTKCTEPDRSGDEKLDPTRPWESVDVVEEHPYIYSLGPC